MDRAALFNDNINLAYHVRWKHFPTINPSDMDDYNQIALLGLHEASLKYEEDSGARFTTFAYGCILNYLRMGHRYYKRHSRSILGTEDDVFAVDLTDYFSSSEVRDDLLRAIDSFDDLDRAILRYRLLGHSQTIIAKLTNVSQPHICKRLRIMKEILYEIII